MTKIAQVARAICRADGRAECAFDDERAQTNPCTEADCAVMRQARAAIEAMREPTEAMDVAMFEACENIPRTGVVPENVERAHDSWNAGIDASLKEEP